MNIFWSPESQQMEDILAIDKKATNKKTRQEQKVKIQCTFICYLSGEVRKERLKIGKAGITVSRQCRKAREEKRQEVAVKRREDGREGSMEKRRKERNKARP